MLQMRDLFWKCTIDTHPPRGSSFFPANHSEKVEVYEILAKYAYDKIMN